MAKVAVTQVAACAGFEISLAPGAANEGCRIVSMRFSSRSRTLVILAAIAFVMTITWAANPSKTSAQDPPDQPSGMSTEAGDTQVQLSWDSPDADSPSVANYELWQPTQSGKLTGATNTKFGFSVAVVGDEAVVGMPEDDDTGAVLRIHQGPGFRCVDPGGQAQCQRCRRW